MSECPTVGGVNARNYFHWGIFTILGSTTRECQHQCNLVLHVHVQVGRLGSHHHALLVDAPHETPELVALDGALGTIGAVVNAAGPLVHGVERRVFFPLALVPVPRAITQGK